MTDPADTPSRMTRHLGKNVVIVGALVAVGFLVAWLRFRPHLSNASAWTDGVREYEVAEHDGSVRYAVWESPVPVPADLAGDEGLGRPALSPDGRWLVFPIGVPGEGTDLWIADVVAGEPVDPRPLTAANSLGDDLAPAFGPDGLWFASDRPGGAGGFDLYRAPYLASGDGVGPAQVVAELSSKADDLDPAPAPDGAAVVFASNRGVTRGLDLFVARTAVDGSFGIEPLTVLNSEGDERDPAFASDGRTLFLASDRRDGAGGFDLYRSALGAEGWVPPVALAGVNSPDDERGPAPSADGFTLLFGRTESGDAPAAAGDEAAPDPGGADPAAVAATELPELWRARSRELFREPGKPVGWLELSLLTVLLLLALLAWLAKRWEQLDVLYKCLLASLIAHVLLMLWFQEVYPERELYAAGERGGGTRMQVRLSGDPGGRSAARVERGGTIELARAEASDTPGRTEADPTEVATGAEAAAAAVEAAARHESETNPSRSATEAASPASRTNAQDVARQLTDGPEAFPLRAGDAPEVALDAAPGARREAPSGGEAPSVEPATAALALPGTTADAPSRSPSVERATRVAQAGAPMRASIRPDPGSDPTNGAAATAMADLRDDPESDGARKRGEAAPLALDGLGPADAASRTVDAGRPDRAAGGAGLDVPTDPGTGSPAPASVAIETARPDAGPSRSVTTTPGPQRAPRLGDDVALADRPAPAEPVASSGGPAAATDAPTMSLDGLGGGPTATRQAGASGPTREAGPSRLDLPSDPIAGAPARAPMERAPARAGSGPSRARLTPDPRTRAGSEVALATPGVPAASLPDPGTSAGTAVPDARPAWDATWSTSGSAPTRSTAGGSAPGGPTRFDLPELPSMAAPATGAVARAERAPDRGVLMTPDDTSPFERSPYRARFGTAKLEALETHGGSEATEAAVAGGLGYLASVQREAGFWGSPDDQHEKYEHVVVGKTGLCLLAFLGAGHWPGSGTEHAEVAGRAIDFLLQIQDEDTGHFGLCSSYGHGIATYALAEYHALTRDARVKPALESATAWILSKQSQRRDPRFFGGWGYYFPNDRTIDRWPRVSVSVWQLMALESARLGGIEVPDAAFDAAGEFLRAAWDDEEGKYRYCHDPGRLNGDYPYLPGSTPAALFGLSLLGDDLQNRSFRRARRWVLQRQPDGYDWEGNDAFVYDAHCNLYFWYYATLAMFRTGGRDWMRWNESLKATLLPSQREDGSWEPLSVYAVDYAGDDRRDASYSTAMAVLTLEVYYRYFTPLLKVK